jgi:hypothetical protein
VAARVKIDENLPDDIADLLSALGLDAVTVADQGWRGMADSGIWQGIQAEGDGSSPRTKQSPICDAIRRGRTPASFCFAWVKRAAVNICGLRKWSSMTSTWTRFPAR